jgi:hypothetical protein
VEAWPFLVDRKGSAEIDERSISMNWTLKTGLARRLFVPVAIGAAMVVILTGCGGSASNPPSVAAGGSRAATSSTTAAPSSSAPIAVATASSPPGRPSLPAVTASHADPALEAMLPAEVSGTAMQRSSATLAALLASGGDRTAVDGFLERLGKSESDGTYAAAFDPTNTIGGGIFAFKIAGVSAGVLLPAIVAVEQSDLGAGATTKQATVGGKSVTIVSVGAGVNDTEWVYGRDDVVFVIHAADEAHAGTFLQALS